MTTLASWRVLGTPLPPIGRLLERLDARRVEVPVHLETIVIGPESQPDPGAVARAAHGDASVRFLILGWIGTHRDARSPLLRGLWDQEERARATGCPVLTLRIAPLLGPRTPLWGALESRPDLPRGGRDVIQPVTEDDVVETLARAFAGRAPWEGWYELVGSEALSLAELRTLADSAGAPRGIEIGWEPPLEVMQEQALAEPQAWIDHFGMTSESIRDAVVRWSS